MIASAERYWVAGIDKEADKEGREKIFMLAWNETDGPQTKENAERFCQSFSESYPHVRYFVIALHNTLC